MSTKNCNLDTIRQQNAKMFSKIFKQEPKEVKANDVPTGEFRMVMVNGQPTLVDVSKKESS